VVSAEPHDSGQTIAGRIARGASLPENFFASRNSDQLALDLGELMRVSVTNLMALLQARNEAKRLTRSGSHTMIQATENNPLKFAPTAEEAMMILFGPKNRSYLDARASLEQAFNDLKVHQVKTYAAMQHAVSMLIAELDPAVIAKDADEHESVLDKVRSRKGRLWDALVTRWKASYGREAEATIQAFMLHFAEHYDRNDRGESR
jgi:type VI secretion system protein ImpI